MSGVAETPPPDLPCRELVEVVTDYLDGAMTAEQVARVDHHLAICAGCAEVLAQWRTVIAVTGELREADVGAATPAVQRSLVAAFRAAHPPAGG